MQYRIQRNNDSLKHHGILGMHWGIRRYQNEDGSYTDAGRKHYGFGEIRKDGFKARKKVKGTRVDGGLAENTKKRIKAITGFYKPDDGNPYVSARRKKNRQDEIDAWNKLKEKEALYKEKKAEKKAADAEKRAQRNKERSEKIGQAVNKVKIASQKVSDVLNSPEVKRGGEALNGISAAYFGLKVAQGAKDHGSAKSFLLGAGLSLAGSGYAMYQGGKYLKNKEYQNSNSLYQRNKKNTVSKTDSSTDRRIRKHINADGTLNEAGRKRYKNVELDTQLKTIQQMRENKEWQKRYAQEDFGSDKVQKEYASDFAKLYNKNLIEAMKKRDKK